MKDFNKKMERLRNFGSALRSNAENLLRILKGSAFDLNALPI